MSEWNKKSVAKEIIHELNEHYGCDLLTSSILARRQVIKGKDILYYMEDDKRFLHNPFLFSQMEDAVDRILDAAEEKEKVLVFGDRDVDGITSTTLLYEYLISLGIDASWKVPSGDEQYGLTIKAVEDFAAAYGTLIITVDCGIRNNAEIAKAAELGIDVIVLDHHEPPEEIPSPAIIIDPKTEDSGYPFDGISGCAVVYKLLTALRFARTELYKQEICLLNVRPVNDAFIVDCIKTQNMAEKERLSETFVPGIVKITQTRLPDFLRGQQIFTWDAPLQKKLLAKIFGNGAEFNFLDLRTEFGTIMPSAASASLLRLAGTSKIARYKDEPSSEIDTFFNLYVTFVQIKTNDKKNALRDEHELQLVALAAIADIMPLRDENRILVRQGLASINKGNIRPGLMELLSKNNMLGKKISSYDLSWNVTPILNSAGRKGEPETAIKLFTAKDANERNAAADRLLELNKERRAKTDEATSIAKVVAGDNFERFSQKLAVAYDERLDRGVTGLTAGKLTGIFKTPAIVIAKLGDDKVIGSIRSPSSSDGEKGYDVTSFFDMLDDLTELYGGHKFAAGFTLQKKDLDTFLSRLENFSKAMELPDLMHETINIDAELPEKYINPDLLKLVDRLEPYGEANPQLIFMSKGLRILQADVMGRTERMHLKLTLGVGRTKWPAIYWGASERLKRDFDTGDKIDILYQINRNTFNGLETPQMIIVDAHKSE
ncbi:MAG: single-stranded-DNA-specific exonuclease RecJ [Spirochaetaceae bacterium]|nr:single-stranded-DNA-specific exonuclease RecJ [Spirochaetaceae bacterium]